MLVVKTFKGQTHTFDLPVELAQALVKKDKRYKLLEMDTTGDESEKINTARRPRKQRS